MMKKVEKFQDISSGFKTDVTSQGEPESFPGIEQWGTEKWSEADEQEYNSSSLNMFESEGSVKDREKPFDTNNNDMIEMPELEELPRENFSSEKESIELKQLTYQKMEPDKSVKKGMGRGKKSLALWTAVSRGRGRKISTASLKVGQINECNTLDNPDMQVDMNESHNLQFGENCAKLDSIQDTPPTFSTENDLTVKKSDETDELAKRNGDGGRKRIHENMDDIKKENDQETNAHNISSRRTTLPDKQKYGVNTITVPDLSSNMPDNLLSHSIKSESEKHFRDCCCDQCLSSGVMAALGVPEENMKKGSLSPHTADVLEQMKNVVSDPCIRFCDKKDRNLPCSCEECICNDVTETLSDIVDAAVGEFDVKNVNTTSVRQVSHYVTEPPGYKLSKGNYLNEFSNVSPKKESEISLPNVEHKDVNDRKLYQSSMTDLMPGYMKVSKLIQSKNEAAPRKTLSSYDVQHAGTIVSKSKKENLCGFYLSSETDDVGDALPSGDAFKDKSDQWINCSNATNKTISISERERTVDVGTVSQQTETSESKLMPLADILPQKTTRTCPVAKVPPYVPPPLRNRKLREQLTNQADKDHSNPMNTRPKMASVHPVSSLSTKCGPENSSFTEYQQENPFSPVGHGRGFNQHGQGVDTKYGYQYSQAGGTSVNMVSDRQTEAVTSTTLTAYQCYNADSERKRNSHKESARQESGHSDIRRGVNDSELGPITICSVAQNTHISDSIKAQICLSPKMLAILRSNPPPPPPGSPPVSQEVEYKCKPASSSERAPNPGSLEYIQSQPDSPEDENVQSQPDSPEDENVDMHIHSQPPSPVSQHHENPKERSYEETSQDVTRDLRLQAHFQEQYLDGMLPRTSVPESDLYFEPPGIFCRPRQPHPMNYNNNNNTNFYTPPSTSQRFLGQYQTNRTPNLAFARTQQKAWRHTADLQRSNNEMYWNNTDQQWRNQRNRFQNPGGSSYDSFTYNMYNYDNDFKPNQRRTVLSPGQSTNTSMDVPCVTTTVRSCGTSVTSASPRPKPCIQPLIDGLKYSSERQDVSFGLNRRSFESIYAPHAVLSPHPVLSPPGISSSNSSSTTEGIRMPLPNPASASAMLPPDRPKLKGFSIKAPQAQADDWKTLSLSDFGSSSESSTPSRKCAKYFSDDDDSDTPDNWFDAISAGDRFVQKVQKKISSIQALQNQYKRTQREAIAKAHSQTAFPLHSRWSDPKTPTRSQNRRSRFEVEPRRLCSSISDTRLGFSGSGSTLFDKVQPSKESDPNDPLACVTWDWKPRFRKTYKRFTYPFIDTHCHLDLLFRNENYSGTYAGYMKENHLTFPENYKGCVAVFCNPNSFNARGKL